RGPGNRSRLSGHRPAKLRLERARARQAQLATLQVVDPDRGAAGAGDAQLRHLDFRRRELRRPGGGQRTEIGERHDGLRAARVAAAEDEIPPPRAVGGLDVELVAADLRVNVVLAACGRGYGHAFGRALYERDLGGARYVEPLERSETPGHDSFGAVARLFRSRPGVAERGGERRDAV